MTILNRVEEWSMEDEMYARHSDEGFAELGIIGEVKEEEIEHFFPSTTKNTAAKYLCTAAETIEERGKQRDQPNGERSMARAVNAYNALFGDLPMDEVRGWQFMNLLKMARSSGGSYREDDYVDAVSYAALAAEAASK